MGKGDGQGETKQKQGQVTRLDLPFFDKIVAILGGIADELLPLLRFLRHRLDYFNAGDRFVETGIQFTKTIALLTGHWIELINIVAQGKDVDDHKTDRCQQQPRVDQADKEHRRGNRHDRFGDQRDAGVHHRVQLAHIIGGARHNVTNALAIVKGLALA